MQLIIGASRNQKIGSKLICCWLGTNYSHVYAQWHLTHQDRDIVYQASHDMVHMRSLERFTKENQIIKFFILDIPEEQFHKFSARCIDLAGETYSKLELLQIFISNLTSNKISFKDQKGYICSELIGVLLHDLGYQFEKPYHTLTPKDIVQSLETTHGCIK